MTSLEPTALPTDSPAVPAPLLSAPSPAHAPRAPRHRKVGVVGREGVERVLAPRLDDVERRRLEASASALRAVAARVGF